jgi:hypothetical protein
MRPIYHRTAERVEAHIFVAALAFLLHCAIEKKLKAARIDLSATEALTMLRSTGRAGVRGALGRTRGVRAQAPHQGDGASAGKARKARTSHCQGKAQSPREGRCRGGARAIRVVDIDLGNGTTKRAVTAPTPRAAAVLRAIGISDLDPPTCYN